MEKFISINITKVLTSPSYAPENINDNADGCLTMHWIPSLWPSKEHKKGFANTRSNLTAFNALVYSLATSKGWSAGSKFLWTIIEIYIQENFRKTYKKSEKLSIKMWT